MLTIYNKKISYTVGVNRILKVYHSNNGRFNGQWYNEAHNFAQDLSEKYNVHLNSVCGIIAALSPLKKWDLNKRITESFLASGISGHTKLQTSKAKEILYTVDPDKIADILRGQKTVSFFFNMLYPDTSELVTIDRHALSVILGYSITDKEGNISANQYKICAQMYVIAAKKVGITPLQMQAITWDIWRTDKKINKV